MLYCGGLTTPFFMQIIKRREAKAKGFMTYFTGKPCRLGHVSERYVGGGNCVTCKQLRYDTSAAALLDPEEREVIWAKRRNSILKVKYGITLDQYNVMLREQNYRCKVCNEVETRKSNTGGIRCLAVDHCHTTGKVRSLLCADCNAALGLLKEDRDRIQKLLEYIS